MSDEEIARLVAERLVRELSPLRVVWFGSRAQGQARNVHGDYDFLVVAQTGLPLGERLLRARWAVRDFPQPMDILVYTPEEYARLSTWTSSVVYEANRTGKVLFETTDRS
ncbi:MAG: nucleotidyltransferase domain-containing protein [Deltaproteobacteria bacterium]|nr:nucleotidyltransferase domain-containing protein [Deltaproteobacteria bacterium]